MTEMDAPWQEPFLTALAEGSTVAHACKAAGVPRSTAYFRRTTDQAFAAAWDDAVEAGTDELEEVAIRRAKDHSDFLLALLLKARRPEKFKDRAHHEHTGKGDGPVQVDSAAAQETAKVIGDLMDAFARAKASGAPDEMLAPLQRAIAVVMGEPIASADQG